MPSRLTFAVAMCTFNGGEYVRVQLESILSGFRRPDEIVVVDDGSSDDTVVVVRDVLARDGIPHRVEVNRPGLGVTRNFQRAAELTRCTVVVLSDQDDRWCPERLETAARAFERDAELLLVHGDARVVDADLRDTGETLFRALEVDPGDLDRIEHGRGFEVYLRRNLATGATMAFRRELLEVASPFPPSWVHDEWLAVMAAAVGKVGVERRALIDYRQHGRNQIGVRRLGFLGKVRRAIAREPGRNRSLAERSLLLAERLQTLNLSAGVQQAAAAKARFETTRAAMPRLRLFRVPVVVRALLIGEYSRYASQGWRDVVRDLLQPR